MTPLVIDPEFRAQIPPPSPEELAELEASIQEHGIRDALVVWSVGRVLLDGHNRYEIARRLGLDFRIVEYEFADRAAAADWIDRNQLGRRNLSPDQMSLLRGRRYNRLKQSHGGQSRGSSKKSTSIRTAVALGREHGVNHATISNDAKFASAVEQLKPLVPDIEQRVISGKGPTRKAVKAAAEVAKADPEAALLILTPPQPKLRSNGLANGVKRLPSLPLAERLDRGVAKLVSVVEALDSHDFSGLTGTTEMLTALESVDGALQRLRRFRNHYGRS